jgi:hypothetical protein
VIRRRPAAYALSAALLGAVVAPAFSDPADDGFPLSTYPMFARDRGRVATTARAVAVAADGAERRLPPSVLGTSETMQAIQTLRRSIAAGPREAERLCRAIAARLRTEAWEGARGAEAPVRVEIQTVAVDSVAYLGGAPEPLSRRVHARCPLRGND